MLSHSLVAHHDSDHIDLFGFWLYILTDCVLFAAIFAAYAVLANNTYGGPTIGSLISVPYVLLETIALLCSSFTYGMVILSTYKQHFRAVVLWLICTMVLGGIFVAMELHEFIAICQDGYNWQTSAALSAFFTLVGTHGLHVSIGLVWMLVLMIQLFSFGLNSVMLRRLNYLAMFWAFLDIIWIFVFTIVYLMGVV
jgi:cytochrome o ubiquinol oxidase subunit 3